MVSGHFTHLPLFSTNEMMKERLQKRLLVTEQKRGQPIWWNVKGTVICEGTNTYRKITHRISGQEGTLNLIWSSSPSDSLIPSGIPCQ